MIFATHQMLKFKNIDDRLEIKFIQAIKWINTMPFPPSYSIISLQNYNPQHNHSHESLYTFLLPAYNQNLSPTWYILAPFILLSPTF